MNTRYHIEELVSQDAGGVVFQGADLVTGVVVAMRRFISTDIGGGDSGNSQVNAYEDAIGVLKKVSHPSLRRVLAGGCDPVDGMPYQVTRWIDGILLGDVVAIEGPLDAEVAVLFLAQLLNANIMLSKALGRDGLWAEASLDSVVVRPPQHENEPATAIFWVSPLRWFEEEAAAGGAMELADFAEAMLGGPRNVSRQHAGTEIADWIQNIRNKELIGLRQIQEALSAPGTPVMPFVLKEQQDADPHIENPDAPPTRENKPKETRPASPSGTTLPRLPPTSAAEASPVVVPPPRSNRKKVAAIAGTLALVALMVSAGWILMPQTEEVAASTGAVAQAAPDGAPRQNPRQFRVDEMMPDIESENAAAKARRLQAEQRGYYTVHEGDLMLDRAGHQAKLRGQLARVRFSSSGLTMYLEFSEGSPLEEPRAYSMSRDLVDGIHAEELTPLIGSEIEIQGEIEIESIAGTRRPRIKLTDRSQIAIMEPEAGYELR